MRKIEPLEDRVLIETVEADEKTAGGILLPDAAKEKPQRGKVIAAGPGTRDEDGNRIALGVAAGDVVVFGRYAGTDVDMNGKTYKIMRERDILAKIKN